MQDWSLSASQCLLAIPEMKAVYHALLGPLVVKSGSLTHREDFGDVEQFGGVNKRTSTFALFPRDKPMIPKYTIIICHTQAMAPRLSLSDRDYFLIVYRTWANQSSNRNMKIDAETRGNMIWYDFTRISLTITNKYEIWGENTREVIITRNVVHLRVDCFSYHWWRQDLLRAYK